MKIIERLKGNYLDKSFYISIYDSSIYLMNYKKIIKVTSENILVSFESFNLSILGSDFRILRKSKYDIELHGIVNNMEIIYG